MSPSQGWQTLHNDSDPDRHALLGNDWKVKARMHPGTDQRLWLNVQLPNGTWTYIVLNPDASIAHQETARTKKECYERTAAALREADEKEYPEVPASHRPWLNEGGTARYPDDFEIRGKNANEMLDRIRGPRALPETEPDGD